MRATGVIARFLSLLDVVLILLGLLMIILMYAQVRSEVMKKNPREEKSQSIADCIDFVFLEAGWKGAEIGRCYLLGSNGERVREVATNTDADIRSVLLQRQMRTGRDNQLVLLLFSDEGWFSAWDPKRLEEIEKTWRLKITPVYNVPLSRSKSS